MISIIIPLYNCEIYIEKAIASAINQKFVTEVIVIDDGSKDTSLQICKQKALGNEIIKVYQHQDKKNHGRSTTRNLGIQIAKGKYVAFLDADDFYLPNRFENDVKILENNKTIDGVYNAISAHFYRKPRLNEKAKLKLTTIRERIKPENLFEAMGPFGHYGYFSGIGLTVKKSIFEKVGFFNNNLVVAEDTELWIKMGLKTKLVSGIIDEPVAMRGVHETNVSFKAEKLYKSNYLKMYESLYFWSIKNEISLDRIVLIWNKIWFYRTLNNSSFVSNMKFWIVNCFLNPKLLTQKRVYKTFPVFKKIKLIFTPKQ